MEFFEVIDWKGWRFYQRFLENSKISFLKNINMWNNFFFKILQFTSFFLFFFYFWHFIFNFVYLYLSKNSRNFHVFLFYGLQILSMNFGKSLTIFLKNIDIWNPKCFINSIVYYLFYFFLSILVILLSYFTNPNLSKNSKHFCGVLLYGL